MIRADDPRIESKVSQFARRVSTEVASRGLAKDAAGQVVRDCFVKLESDEK